MTCIVVLMTVVVNGSSVASIIHRLGLDKLPDDRLLMLDEAARKLDDETAVFLAALRNVQFMESTNWRLVRSSMFHKQVDASISDLSRAAQQRALNLERNVYLEAREAGELSEAAMAELVHFISAQQAGANSSMTANELKRIYAKHVSDLIGLFRIPRYLRMLQRSRIWGVARWADDAVFEQLGLAYEVGKAFVKAHNGKHESMGSERPSQAALIQVVRAIEEDRQGLTKLVIEELRDLQRSNPEVCAAVETRYATSLMLRKQRHLVEVMMHHGEIVDLDGEKLVEEINSQLKRLQRVHPRALGKLDDPAVLLEVPALRFLVMAAEAVTEHQDPTMREQMRENLQVTASSHHTPPYPTMPHHTPPHSTIPHHTPPYPNHTNHTPPYLPCPPYPTMPHHTPIIPNHTPVIPTSPNHTPQPSGVRYSAREQVHAEAS